MIDVDDLIEKVVGFYDSFCPYSFIEDSSQGTHTSAVLDIVRMTRTRSGVDGLIYNLTETLNIDIVPELKADPDDTELIEFRDTVKSLIEELTEYREQLPEERTDTRLPKGYAEVEYDDFDDPEAVLGARWDDMNYQHYIER